MNRRLAVLLAVAGVLLAVAVVLPRVIGGQASTDDTSVPLTPAATHPAPVATTSTTLPVSLRDPFVPLVDETPPPPPAQLPVVPPTAVPPATVAPSPALYPVPAPDPAP